MGSVSPQHVTQLVNAILSFVLQADLVLHCHKIRLSGVSATPEPRCPYENSVSSTSPGRPEVFAPDSVFQLLAR